MDTQKEESESVNFYVNLSTHLIASQSAIYYDFKLISTLLADGAHSKIETALISFKRKFHTYLLDKNIKVFCYLKQSVNLEIKESAAISRSRSMNNDLSRSVNRFLNLYLKNGELHLPETEIKTFEKYLEQLGKEIGSVMRDERDSLFPIYDRQGHEFKNNTQLKKDKTRY